LLLLPRGTGFVQGGRPGRAARRGEMEELKQEDFAVKKKKKNALVGQIKKEFKNQAPAGKEKNPVIPHVETGEESSFLKKRGRGPIE